MEVKLGLDAKAAMLRGVSLLAEAVAVTLGPCGRNVAIEKSSGLTVVTKDGVSVAREIRPTDPFEAMGARLVREAASKTVEAAGDGTTTSTVIAHTLIRTGMERISNGVASVTAIKRGMELAAAAADAYLMENSKPVSGYSDVLNIATISANGDAEIGAMVADAHEKVNDGVITLEDSKTAETYVSVTDGFRIEKGYVSPYFVTDTERLVCEFENPLVLVADVRITSAKQMTKILELVVAKARPLVLIADDVSGDALSLMLLNTVKGAVPSVAVKPPAFGDRRQALMEDLANVTGAVLISDKLGTGIDSVTDATFGQCASVTVASDHSVMVGARGNRTVVDARAASVRAELARTSDPLGRERLNERLKLLMGKAAVIHVGALTEASQIEKKDRVEDALHATKAAKTEGVLPGGGLALLSARSAVQACLDGMTGDEKIGAELVMQALDAPMRVIVSNAGRMSPEEAIGGTLDKNAGLGLMKFGLDSVRNEWVDMVEAGIMDPTKVTRAALANAVAVAATVLTTECVISNKQAER